MMAKLCLCSSNNIKHRSLFDSDNLIVSLILTRFYDCIAQHISFNLVRLSVNLSVCFIIQNASQNSKLHKKSHILEVNKKREYVSNLFRSTPALMFICMA